MEILRNTVDHFTYQKVMLDMWQHHANDVENKVWIQQMDAQTADGTAKKTYQFYHPASTVLTLDESAVLIARQVKRNFLRHRCVNRPQVDYTWKLERQVDRYLLLNAQFGSHYEPPVKRFNT